MSSCKTIRIGTRAVGPGRPVFIIAEAGVNHNGDVIRALELVDAASEAGADAVKFQTFRGSEIASTNAPKAKYQEETTGREESQLQMIQQLELSAQSHRQIVERCLAKEILFLSTPFDAESADMLETLLVPAYKIPSGEITNWRFLEHIAAKGKPVILSTGMSYLLEVKEAVHVLRTGGCSELAILHCTSSYPAPPDSVNLRAMQTMAEVFQVPIGFSDHTMGIEVALAAAALGASIIEKHLTLDRSLPGPDHQASIEPSELQTLVRGVRNVESALGDGLKQPTVAEQDVRMVARRSIVARTSIPCGTVIHRDLITFKRPGTGIQPSSVDSVIGRTTLRTIPADELIDFRDLQ